MEKSNFTLPDGLYDFGEMVSFDDGKTWLHRLFRVKAGEDDKYVDFADLSEVREPFITK